MLLDNVLSFEVMVDWTQSSVTGSTFAAANDSSLGNWDSPFDTLYYAGGNAGKNPTFTNAGVFDTWSRHHRPPRSATGTTSALREQPDMPSPSRFA